MNPWLLLSHWVQLPLIFSHWDKPGIVNLWFPIEMSSGYPFLIKSSFPQIQSPIDISNIPFNLVFDSLEKIVLLFPLNPTSPASFLFKIFNLCCDVNGDYLLFYSWFYMNFQMFYWNIARIPTEIMIVETTFLFWWCITLVKFGWEVAPQRLLFEWKSMSEKFGRGVTPPCFHFQSKSSSHAEVTPPWFYFWMDLPFSCYGRGQISCHMLFSGYKRQEHTSKMQAKREKHARNMQDYPAHDYTPLAPFSPSLMGLRMMFTM